MSSFTQKKQCIKWVINTTMNITFLCNKLAIQLHATQCTNFYTSTSKPPEALLTLQQKHEHILRRLTFIQDLMHADNPPLTPIRVAQRKIRRFPRIHHHRFQSAMVMMSIEWTWWWEVLRLALSHMPCVPLCSVRLCWNYEILHGCELKPPEKQSNKQTPQKQHLFETGRGSKMTFRILSIW